MNDELGFKPAHELAAMLAKKKISSVELTEYFIARIQKYDEVLNAVVVRDFARAMDAARTADTAMAAGQNLGPLHGLPMTIKESYNIEGLKTTWGFPIWKDMVASTDAAVVAAYKAAGAHFMGKTNVPMMLADYQSYNEIYGQTNNPWDVSRSPGGSSGGAAAALAAGLCALESGSDIGGSIRNPAHFCGVYGHKPTWGVVPISGHQPPVVQVSNGVDLAVVGPLARSAEDLKLAMDLIVGPQPLQVKGWRVELPTPRATKLKDLRVAIWATDAASPVEQEIVERTESIGQLLESAGATVSYAARPEVDLMLGGFTYVNLMQAVNMSGVPPQMFAQNQTLADSFDADDRSMDAVFARAAVQTYNDWAIHDRNRTHIRLAWNQFFENWDIMLCPILPTTAFPHDHAPFSERRLKINGEPRDFFEGSFWAGLTTLAGLPSTVFPTGLSSAGLPIGLQAASAEFDDYTCIEFARLMAQELGGFVPPDGYA